MDTATKNYIDSLDRRSIPWNRMFTAYGTAEHYNGIFVWARAAITDLSHKKRAGRSL